MKKSKDRPKKADKWACKYHLTQNFKTWTSACFDTLLRRDFPVEIVAYKHAYEVGESGNLHEHLYIVLKRSWRESSLISRFKGTDVEAITPGTEQTVINYIGSTEKAEIKGCHIISVSTKGDIETTQGQRNDISTTDAVLWQIKDAIDGKASLRSLWNDFFPYMVRHGNGIRSYYELTQRENSVSEREYSIELTAQKNKESYENLLKEREMIKDLLEKQVF